MTEQEEFLRICDYLSQNLGEVMRRLPFAITSQIHEIRLRAGKPVTVFTGHQSLCLHRNASISSRADGMVYTLTPQELQDCFRQVCEYSIHSFQEEIKQGFVTIRGGHRVGICGTGLIESGQVCGVKDVSSLNIRVARQVMGAADQLLAAVFTGGLHSTLIIGEVGSGKTTLLRDAVRQLSNGYLSLSTDAVGGTTAEIMPIKIAIMDERGEIAATYQGIAQHDVGRHTDIYHLYPKAIGMNMALRTLSPQMIVCDEIGREDDIQALLESMHTGTKVLATAHGTALSDVLKRGKIAEFVTLGGFERVVTLVGHRQPTAIQYIEEIDSTCLHVS